MLAYFGYDTRFNYGEYRITRHPHVKSLLAEFNRTLLTARELESEGLIKVIRVYKPKNGWDVNARYFIYETNDIGNRVHNRFMKHGGGLGRGCYHPMDKWAIPNEIDNIPNHEVYTKYYQFRQREEEKLPIILSEKMANQFRFLKMEIQAEEWNKENEA